VYTAPKSAYRPNGPKALSLLNAAADETSARLSATESDAMDQCLIPKAETHSGNGESIPLGDDSVDAVFSADAFHWLRFGRGRY